MVRIHDDGMSLTTLDGRYHVVDRIAAGGMGEVFLAHDAVLAREVAIKVLHRSLSGDPGFIDRFRREARAAGGLSHPNIVAVHDWGAVDGIYYMVMELVRGQSLREILNAEGLLAPAQATEILLQVLEALAHAHAKGIVHRDVKPENILVMPNGVAKVTDFGLARAYADARATYAGSVTGTVQYLAPEQLQGEPADPRTDLYSLGIVAYELLTGSVPFGGETTLAIAYKHVRERVPKPSLRNPAVPPGLDGWVASMTEKERELRPESATEARRDLAAEAATLPPAPAVGELVRVAVPAEVEAVAPDPQHAPTVTIPRAERPRGRWGHRLLWILFALLLAGGVGWATWTYAIPHSLDVPNVVRMSVDTATAKLEGAGLSVRTTEGRYSLKVDAGDVIRMDPPAGTSVRTGSTVTLVPSLGPQPVPVPDLANMTVPEATKALRQAHLQLGIPTREYSDTVAVGHVIRQSEPANTEIPRGRTVDVVLSKGPTPLPVPKVIGKPEDQAKALLQDWAVKAETRFSDTVRQGDVIAQRPAPKTALQPGQTVTIVVSLGPRTFPMPSVVGMSKDAAAAELRALGLRVAALPVPGSSGNNVVSQIPGAGTTVKYGQTVTIYVA